MTDSFYGIAGRHISDDQLRGAVYKELLDYQGRCNRPAMALLETAGGPASPSPSGRLQVLTPACSWHM